MLVKKPLGSHTVAKVILLPELLVRVLLTTRMNLHLYVNQNAVKHKKGEDLKKSSPFLCLLNRSVKPILFSPTVLRSVRHLLQHFSAGYLPPPIDSMFCPVIHHGGYDLPVHHLYREHLSASDILS